MSKKNQKPDKSKKKDITKADFLKALRKVTRKKKRKPPRDPEKSGT